MVSWRVATAVMAVVACVSRVAAVDTKATVTQYVLQTADTGSCRLKGIDSNSDNFKFYASVSGNDVGVNEGCARCIKVSKDGVAASLTAYVLDVCQGCKAGELKLSSAALAQLAIDPNSNNATVSYRIANCPASFLSGNVKACLMEGASNSYIPLQFYNAQKAIVNASISGIAATQNKNSFFFFSSPNTGNANGTQWFKNVQVTVSSADGESQTGSFEFGGTSGCATSSFQFSVSSTGSADDSGAAGSGKSDGGKSSVLLPVLLGCVAALLLIIGSIFFVRRRRASSKDVETPHDGPEDQYLSPTTKGNNPRSPERPTYAADHSLSLNNSTDDQSDGEPNSPTVAFDDADTPVASSAAARNPYGETKAQRHISPPPQQKQQQYEAAPVQQTQQARQQEIAAGAPRVAYSTYVAPQSFAFSKPVTADRTASNNNNNSFRQSSARAAPTFPAPVLPARAHEEEAGGRSSFDIDDMRETEEVKERERFSSMADEVQAAPYHSDSPYASGHVTSPQSYVRATSLRRNSTKVPADRPTLRFTSTQAQPSSQRQGGDSFDDYSDRDSYASAAYGRGTSGSDAHMTGSFRESAPGYSRESLGILGYPHAKKPRGRNSITEAQL